MAKAAKSAKFYGTGRRKKSIARVYLVPGKGDITINKRSIDEYFGLETLKVIVRQPLTATETADKYDVIVNVKGGGYTGQAGAIRHGIARALLQVDNEFRPTLKKAGYLTRDPRMKERKKYGLKASYIHIDVEFGEGEGKIPVDSIAKRAEAYKPKEKVTYKMIKEYIEAKYGFKVHTAYIAEVKRNLGLPMYDAPNAVEELKQPRKHPTPEKVEAIKDALRYFAVI